MANISNFSHGFNNRIDPSKLNDGITPVYLTNADISSGSVQTIKGPTPIQDTLVYPRTSGYLFFVSYGSPEAPAISHPTPSVSQQANTVDFTPADNTSNPVIPASIKLNLAALPNVTNLRSNLGPRGTVTNNVGNRDGKFIGTWNVYGNQNLRRETGLDVNTQLQAGTNRATKATFSGGFLFYSTKPKPDTTSPYRDENGNIVLATGTFDGDPRAGVFRDGPITIVLRVHGKEEQIFSGVAGGVGNIEGGQYVNLNLGAEGNAAQEAFNLTDEQARTAEVDIWATHSLRRWSLDIPPLSEDLQDQLWITYVSFNDDNTVSFSTPTAIDRSLAPSPLTEISKQPNRTLGASGLTGYTHINGYLYLSRPLTQYSDGPNALFNPSASPRITGFKNADDEIQWLRIEGVQNVLPYYNTKAVKLTIPTALPNAEAGTYTFEAGVVSGGLTITMRLSNDTVIGTPNITLSTAELQAATNPPRLIHRILGPATATPSVNGGSYDTIRDVLTVPTDENDNPWDYEPFIKADQETWRIAVVLQDSSTPVFGTPIKVYNGNRSEEAGALETIIRVPAAPSLMSRDRPLRIAVGGDLSGLKAATPYFYLKDGVWYFGETDRDYVEYQDKLYFTQEAAVPTYIKEDGNEAAMGIPRPDPAAVDGITITGSNLPGAWNPIVREIDLGDASNNPFTGNYGRQFQYFTEPFSGFDQSRIIRTADSNVGGNELYNSVISTLPASERQRGDTEFLGINHLQIILNVWTSDATLIRVGNVNCSNFEFSVKYGSGGGGHGRPTPIAIINGDTYYDMILTGGSWHAPTWRLGKRRSKFTPRDTNRTVTFNRLPKPIPQGRTHTIDWEVSKGGGENQRINYRLGAFVKNELIRTYDFNITSDANELRFIISDRGIYGWHYKLYRAFSGQYHEVQNFKNGSNTTNSRNLIGTDDLTDTSTEGKDAIGDIASTLPTIIQSNTTYAITNVNEGEELESPPTIVDTEIENNANARIILNNIPIETDPRVQYRYIYKVDSIYPQFGFIGKIGPRDTAFEDNVNFTQDSIFIYTKRLTEAPPPLPEVSVFTRDSTVAKDAFKQRQPGNWDGNRLTPPTGWERERSAFDEGERLYRSRVRLTSSASGNITSYTATYSIPEEVNPEGLIIRVGEPLNSVRNFEPPSSIRFLTLYNGTMFGADGNILYFSRYGHPHYWPKEYFSEFDEPITGLLSVQRGLLIFTKFKTYILIGSNVNNFVVSLVSAEQGCVNHKTAVFVKGTPYWVSDDGIVSYLNGRVEVISRSYIGDDAVHSINWTNVKNAVYWKDIYHVLLGDGNAEESGQSFRFDNKVLCLDLRYFPKVYMCDGLEFDNKELPQRIGRFDDNKLYMVTKESPRVDDFKLYELGTNNRLYLDATWESQNLTDNDPGRRKIYNEVYLAYEGQLEVETIIDGRSVSTIVTPLYDPTLPTNSSNKPVYEMGLPKGSNAGYTIKFKVRAIGGTTPSKLISISYEPEPRKDNPRIEGQGRPPR